MGKKNHEGNNLESFGQQPLSLVHGTALWEGLAVVRPIDGSR